MSAFRRYPFFASALLVLALVFLAAGWCLYERWTAAHAAEAKVKTLQTELATLTDTTPPPSRETSAQIEADLAHARSALAAMQAELKGHGPAATELQNAKPPGSRPAAYFDLASFVEQAREHAAHRGVAVKADEYFGFASYAHEGPEMEMVPLVFRQRQVAASLIDALIEARPRQILMVQRERPLTKAEREARAAAEASGNPVDAAASDSAASSSNANSADFFDLDSRVSARVPGFVDTTAFRLTFTGQSPALRTFLNKLAGFELPLVVRAVEAEPAAADEPGGAAAEEAPAPATPSPSSVIAAPTAVAAKPIVGKLLTKFTVTVEFIDLVTPPPPPA